jgi:hypothetical protein
LQEIEEHVDKRVTNLQIAGKTPNKEEGPANWKSKTTSEAAQAVTATNGLHRDYCHKPGHSEDRFFKKKREINS